MATCTENKWEIWANKVLSKKGSRRLKQALGAIKEISWIRKKGGRGRKLPVEAENEQWNLKTSSVKRVPSSIVVVHRLKLNVKKYGGFHVIVVDMAS